jgi:hypothetical protein
VVRREEKVFNPELIKTFFAPSASSFYDLPTTKEAWEFPQDYFLASLTSGLSMIYSEREKSAVGISVSKNNYSSYRADLDWLKTGTKFPFEKRSFNEQVTKFDKYIFVDENFYERRADLYANVVDGARFIKNDTSLKEREQSRDAGVQTALHMMGDFR